MKLQETADVNYPHDWRKISQTDKKILENIANEAVRAWASTERDWYFTFNTTFERSLYHDNYVKIFGTFENARTEMIRRFGHKWCLQFPSPESAGIELRGLTEIL